MNEQKYQGGGIWTGLLIGAVILFAVILFIAWMSTLPPDVGQY